MNALRKSAAVLLLLCLSVPAFASRRDGHYELYVVMPDGSKYEVFGPSQGLKLVIASNAPLMAKLPIDPEIARLADAGLIESYESPESEELMTNFLEVAPEKHPQVPVAAR